MKPPTIMIHTPTGKILSVDYWILREVLGEAKRHLRNSEVHYELINRIEDHLISSTY